LYPIAKNKNHKIMNSLYQQALSFYSQGDYEGAWDLLQNIDLETEQEIRLFKECDKLVAEKAVYVLRSYIEEGKIKEAKNYKIDFLSKYGYRSVLATIEIPEEVQPSQCYTQQSVNEQEQIVTEQKTDITEQKASFGKVFGIIATILVFVIGIAYFLSLDKEGVTSDTSTLENETVEYAKKLDSPKVINIPNKFEYINKSEDTYKVDVEWPLSLTGITDISKIQKILIKHAFNENDINTCVENYFRKWKNTEPLGDYGTESEITVKFQQCLNDLYIFKIHIYADYGGGTGASTFCHDEYIYFDKNTESELSIDGIFIDNSTTLSIVNSHISLDEYAGKAEKLPDNIIISASGIIFIFPKYSIGYGYQGEVEISVGYDELNNVLSNTFKNAIGR